MALFGGRTGGSGGNSGSARTSRHSSGWSQLQKHLRARESLRVLDIGPTSAGNINFITNLAHSVYMANLVEDAARLEYKIVESEGSETGKVRYDIPRFLQDNLDFAGRVFDVVLLWDTTDYLPEPLIQPVLNRIHDVMEPGGQLLALFHSRATADDTVFSRYHLTSTDELEIQKVSGYPILNTFTTRQIETLFSGFASNKFFLAKDTLREVIVVR